MFEVLRLQIRRFQVKRKHRTDAKVKFTLNQIVTQFSRSQLPQQP